MARPTNPEPPKTTASLPAPYWDILTPLAASRVLECISPFGLHDGVPGCEGGRWSEEADGRDRADRLGLREPGLRGPRAGQRRARDRQLTIRGLASNSGAHPIAQVADLVDALASGASGRKVVKVQVLSWAPFLIARSRRSFFAHDVFAARDKTRSEQSATPCGGCFASG